MEEREWNGASSSLVRVVLFWRRHVSLLMRWPRSACFCAVGRYSALGSVGLHDPTSTSAVRVQARVTTHLASPVEMLQAHVEWSLCRTGKVFPSADAIEIDGFGGQSWRDHAPDEGRWRENPCYRQCVPLVNIAVKRSAKHTTQHGIATSISPPRIGNLNTTTRIHQHSVAVSV